MIPIGIVVAFFQGFFKAKRQVRRRIERKIDWAGKQKEGESGPC